MLKEICIRVGINAPLQKQLDAYKRITEALHRYLEQLQRIDIEAFHRETQQFERLASYTDRVLSEQQLNTALKICMSDLGIDLPWKGEFDTFMQDKNKHLVFE